MRRFNGKIKSAFNAVLSLLLVLSFACSPFNKPRLVVFIVIDQMRADTIDRFEDIFQGGFRYLLDHGTVFTEARHDHAYTSTSSGHFAIATGLHPGHTGITGNDLYHRELKEKIYCIYDDESKSLTDLAEPCSFRTFSFTTLGDWLKTSDSKSKVYSVSGKAHAAVPLGGEKADGVFWFDFDVGSFVTSDYYMPRYPEWFSPFSSPSTVKSYFGQTWNRLLNDTTIYYTKSRRDDFFAEVWKGPTGGATFPHFLPEIVEEEGPDYELLEDFPWLDENTLDLAKALVYREKLGIDHHTDILFISLSMADYVGHRFGPFSQESMDTFLRLDHMLGIFFNEMEKKIGLDNILFVLTSDHGCSPLPEYSESLGHKAGRMDRFLKGYDRKMDLNLSKRWGEDRYIEIVSNNSIYYNLETLHKKGLSEEDLNSILVPMISKEEWAGAVYTRKQLQSEDSLDCIGELWRHQYHPENSGNLFVTPALYYLIWKPVGTTHEDAHDYNRHVPFIISGPELTSTRLNTEVRTVDIAPIVAELLGIQIPKGLDGKVISVRESRNCKE